VSHTQNFQHLSLSPYAAVQGSRARRSYPSHDEMRERERLVALLVDLRAIVPVVAHELAGARRQVAALRAVNGWLMERMRQLQRPPVRLSRCVELTTQQSMRIESLSDECAVVGVQDGCPLVRLVGGDIALLESNGRLAPARRVFPNSRR
jgi:hypothetical protein